MAAVLVHEVSLFISRSTGQTSHVFYSIAFLNRVASLAAPRDERVRVLLLRTYFSLFKKLLKEDQGDENEEKKQPVKDRSRSKQENARAARQKPQAEEIGQEDNKVAELVLKGVNVLLGRCKAQLIDSDTGSDSGAELKRLIEDETGALFKLAHHSVFKLAVQALKLLFQFARQTKKKDDSFADRYYRALYEALLRLHLNKAARMDEFFALLFKSIKTDVNPQRVLAFVRRILQMAMVNEASFTAACLLIVSELVKCKTDLKFQLYSLEQMSGVRGGLDGDSDEEHFVDVDRDEEMEESKLQESGPAASAKGQYDPLKREPQYANAEATPLFELVHLSNHAHPTVRLWASELLQGKLLSYSGDPLLDFGIANFLDRIAYKNPKSLDKLATSKHQFASNRRMAATEQPINLYAFAGTGADDDKPEEREEERYLYKYFETRGPKEVGDRKRDKEAALDDEDLDMGGSEGEDPEMEEFAQGVIEKEMKRLNAGKQDLEDEDDDVLSQLEGESEEEDDENSDFFGSEEDLQDVKLKDDDESDYGQEEGEDDVSDEDEDEDYGEQAEGDDEEDDEDIFEQDEKKAKGSKKQAKTNIFAEYDEFAHLLEGDLYNQEGQAKKPKFAGPSQSSKQKEDEPKAGKGEYVGKKRSFTQRGGSSGGRGGRGSDRGGSFRGGRGGAPRGGSNKGDSSRGSSRGRGSRGRGGFGGGKRQQRH